MPLPISMISMLFWETIAMSRRVRIGAGSGFWGDALDPAVELLRLGRLDYLGMDYLAELTMVLLQRQLARDPACGYIRDLREHMAEILPPARRAGTRIVSNAGGLDPRGAAEVVAGTAKELALPGLRIAALTGDDVRDQVAAWVKTGVALTNTETGDTDVVGILDRVTTANVYLGADGIVEALALGADVIVTGRVADSSLFVGPLAYEFGWALERGYEDRLAGAVALGHVIECAAGASGGMSSRWSSMPDMGFVGFPYVDAAADGSGVVSKVRGSGGRVDQWTVKEHLTYEVLDPRRYEVPDGVADFTSLEVEDLGRDRVRIRGAKGRGRPELLKLVMGYDDGWIGEGMLFFPWPDALGRAAKAKATLLERFDRLDLRATAVHFDFVGVDMLHGLASPDASGELNEVGLRVAVRTRTRSEAEKVRRACAQLWTLGPGGTSFGTPFKPRPATGLWPALVPRGLVQHKITMVES